MDHERLEEIEQKWLGFDKKSGLAIVGNDSYKMVAELINEIKILANEIGLKHGSHPFPDLSQELYSRLSFPKN